MNFLQCLELKKTKTKTTSWKCTLTVCVIQQRACPKQTTKIDLDSSVHHRAEVNYVLSCGLTAKQSLSQAISLIKPLNEVLKGALLTAVCLCSHFLTHWHARLMGASVKAPVTGGQVVLQLNKWQPLGLVEVKIFRELTLNANRK